MIKITMPKSLTKYTINKISMAVFDQNLRPKDNEFEIDLRTVEFLEPAGIAFLYNLCMWGRIHNEVDFTFEINTINPSYKNRQAMLFLEDVGFFKEFFDQEIFKTQCLRDTTLEVKMIAVKEYYQWSQYSLLTWLRNCTKREDSFSNILVAVEEIFNNIGDHSNENVGCVFGQFFPRRDIITIAICDFGKGIPSAMRKKYPEYSDLKLLKTALIEGESTRSTPRNRGAGLPNIIKSITNSQIGTVHILSNYAKIRIEDQVQQGLPSKEYYPGTLLELEIDIANLALYEPEEEEEFEW